MVVQYTKIMHGCLVPAVLRRPLGDSRVWRFRVYGLGFWDLGFRGSGFRKRVRGFRVLGSGMIEESG